MLATQFQVFIDILLYLLALLCLWGAMVGKKVYGAQRFTGYLAVILFLLFAYWGGDYFHYLDGYNNIKSDSGFESSFESVYYWIAAVSPSYFFFRLWIWGSCFALVVLVFKKLRIPVHLGIVFFVSLALLRISYARASLAMAIMYYGLALFEANRRSFLVSIIGIAVIASSYFFHKSAYFGIAMVFASIVMSIVYKKGVNWIGIAVFFIAAFVLVYLNIDNLMMASSEDMNSTYSVDIAQKYLGRDVSERGWGGQIRDFLEMVPHYMGLLLYIRLYRKKAIIDMPRAVQVFVYLFLMILLVASVFAFDFGLNTFFLYQRFMRFNTIPLSVFTAYCYSRNIERKWCSYIFFIGIFVSLFTLYYSFSHAS